MRALAFTLVLAASAAQAVAHPMPHSTAVVQAGPGAVELAVSIPITELKAATSGEPAGEAGRYVEQHAAVTGADGRLWLAEIRDVQPTDFDGDAVMAVTLVFTPAAGASSQAASLRYDAVTHRIASHFVKVYRRTGGDLVPLVRLQSPATELALP